MSVVTPAEIREIPRRYAIGKRPLSLLLGWGELTYTRLLDGNTPTPQHAAELRRLLDDPAAYARLLETGKHRVTEMAYSRSFNAVDEILADQGGAARATRIFAVADRLCVLAGGDLTPSALQRLVYYAQGLGLASGIELFDELPRAAESGPEYDRIHEGYTYDEIQRVAGAVDDIESDESLTKAEIEVVETAFKRYGKNSGQELARMSRDEAPWKKARKRAGDAAEEGGAEPITAKSMRKFFGKK